MWSTRVLVFKGDKGTKELHASGMQFVDKRKENSNPPYTNSPIGQPAKTTVCGDREFWFVDGQDQKTEDGLNARLNKKASDKCEDERNKAAVWVHWQMGTKIRTRGMCRRKIHMRKHHNVAR